MPPSPTTPVPEPVEFSIEDALLNTWEDEGGDYLRLDTSQRPAIEPPSPPDRS